jgi:hypothetical protein
MCCCVLCYYTSPVNITCPITPVKTIKQKRLTFSHGGLIFEESFIPRSHKVLCRCGIIKLNYISKNVRRLDTFWFPPRKIDAVTLIKRAINSSVYERLVFYFARNIIT